MLLTTDPAALTLNRQPLYSKFTRTKVMRTTNLVRIFSWELALFMHKKSSFC